MTKFEKISTKVFVIFFAIAAVAELIGFFSGKPWCIYPAFLSAAVSVMIHFAAKAESKKYQQSKQNNHGRI